MQQPMGIKGVVDPGALLHVEAKSQLRATVADHFLALRELLGGRTIFVCNVLGDVLTAGPMSGLSSKG